MTAQPGAETASVTEKEIADLQAHPTPQTLYNTGVKLFLEQRGTEAFQLILDIVAKHLDDTNMLVAAASLLREHTARHDVVVILMRHIVQREPYNLPARVALACALITSGAETDGYALFSSLIEQYPTRRSELCEHLSKALLDVGRFDEVIRILEAWNQTGDKTCSLLHNMAYALNSIGRSREAQSWYLRALELSENDKHTFLSYTLSLLKSGDFKQGWLHYMQRDLCTTIAGSWVTNLQRLRHNSSIAGKRVILYQEQGFGDTLQFIRSVTWLIDSGADVTIAAPRPLVRLLTQSFPRATVKEIRKFTENREEGYDYSAPIPDLPYIVGVVSDETIPANIPYLRADPADIEKFAALLPPGRPRVGLVWAGAQRIKAEFALTDRRRSSNLQDMASALTPVDATLVNLQFGPPHQQILAWTGQTIADPMRHVNDMADTAAIMENLDLIISVDTSPLHLAGGLGRPTWLVSRRDACWRWRDEGDTTPWYPGMRIFRAKELSFVPTWKEVGAALHEWVANWKAPS